jgi:hypothetical protein
MPVGFLCSCCFFHLKGYVKWELLHHIFYWVPHCDFHHTDGDLMPVPWSFWIDMGEFIFMEPLLFVALDNLMEVFGWKSFNFSWLDVCASFLVVFSHVLALLNTPWLHFLWMWSILSHYGGLVYMLYLGYG